MPKKIRIALIDLYDGIANEGIRAITESIDTLRAQHPELDIAFDRFDTRVDAAVPGLEYDVYLSSGGPGSPFEGEGHEWENNYFEWLRQVVQHNSEPTTAKHQKKHVLFICHSFQMMCRYFKVAEITKRHSPSFGILKVHKTAAGMNDSLFSGLPDPFYAADFRSYQVLNPDLALLEELGGQIIALEKKRPHTEYERAIMGIRISEEMVGVQFHPEADPPGMKIHFEKPERRTATIAKHSVEKYNQIMDRLDDPDYLEITHQTIIPNFYSSAIASLTKAPNRLPAEQETHV